MDDKDPLEILFDTYWTASGWRDEPIVSAEDRAIAEAHGFMFPSETLSHGQAVSRAVKAVEKTAPSKVARAFLDGLGRQSPIHRSALASYANGLPLRPHRYHGEHACDRCGQYDSDEVDFSIFNFERYKFGGVRHDLPAYIAFDLEQFPRLDVARPVAAGTEKLVAILDALAALPVSARASDAVKAIAPLIKENDVARRSILEVLGYCGILRVKGTPAVWQKQRTISEKEPPPKPSKNDWSYPLNWWRGTDGVDRAMAEHWFGEFGLK
jgi:hypothetical protein